MMAALTSKRRDASRGTNNSKKKGRCHLIKKKEAKRRIPCVGVGGEGAAKMATQTIPPPQDADSPPK